MTLNLEALESSFDLVAPRGDELMDVFYAWLFAAAPTVKPLFAGFATSRIVAQTFYARSEAATAVRWGVVSIAANVVAALALMGPLGHAGLAAAASVGAYVNLVSLLAIARLRLGRLGGRALVSGAVRTTLASLPLAALCWLALAWWPAHPSFVIDAAWLAVTMAVGAAVFWAASAALGISERTALVGLYRRRERDGTR